MKKLFPTFINADARFLEHDLFDPRASRTQIRHKMRKIYSTCRREKKHLQDDARIFLLLWRMYYSIMEMSQGEEKDMLLKGFKKLSRILAGQLWLLREDEIRKIYFSLRETRRKVLSGNYGGVRASVSEIHFFVEGVSA